MRIRRQLKEVDPTLAKSFDEERLFQRLLVSLPSEYDAVVDTMESLKAHNVEYRIRILQDKEDRLQRSSESIAMLSIKQPSRPTRQPSYQRSDQKQDQKRSQSRKPWPCPLCKGSHKLRDCECLPQCQIYAAGILAAAKGKPKL